MNNEFVTYEQAVALKELGFDEPCFFAFDNCSTPMRCSDLRTNEQKFHGVNYNSSTYTSQPTYSKAFKFFREKHQLFQEIQIDQTSSPKFCFKIIKFVGNPTNLSEKEWYWEDIKIVDWFLYRTYEETEQACLDKLIEICKNK